MSAQPTSPSAPEHLLPGQLLQKQVQVTVAGCGGTGAAIAAGLPLLHQAMLALGHPHGLDVCFVDGDKISRTNCVRQPFCENEIGLYKSTVLATRINLFYGLGWRASTRFVDESWRDGTDILISCVDTRKARNTLMRTHAYRSCHYWLDIGNNAATGQFVLGQPDNDTNAKTPCRLPTVAELFPEIVDPKHDERDSLPACGAVEALTRQEPFINQSLANLALAMLARLFRHGRLSYHAGFVNLAGGMTAAVPVSPSAWQRLFEANKSEHTPHKYRAAARKNAHREQDDKPAVCLNNPATRAAMRFLNYYVHCGTEWTDEWDCMCNDQCPECHTKDIEPYQSQEINDDGTHGKIIRHVPAEWIPEQGRARANTTDKNRNARSRNSRTQMR